MILSKEVEVRLNAFNVEYYKSLGYEIPMKRATTSSYKKYKKFLVYDFNQTLKVKIEDLPKGSNVRVEVLCDWCQKNKALIQYGTYNKSINISGNYACKECGAEKRNQIVYEKYGVDNVAQIDEVKRRMKTTSKERYGYDNPAKSPKVKEKISQTLYANSSQRTSRQQTYLFNLYKSTDSTTELNYPISHFNADICLSNEKIDIEYDGGFHNGTVQTGRLTQEEFDHKELIRDKIIKSEGYKIIRIKSNSDKLPSDHILLQMLSEAKQYFSETAHSWMTFDIDNSRMINAENKDANGIPYSFGELRKIKDSDLPETETNNNNTNLKGA